MRSLGNIVRVGVLSLGLAWTVAGCDNVGESFVECDDEVNEFPANIIQRVCGIDEVTYDSPLFACQEVGFYSPGICREVRECQSMTPKNTACPAIYEPVCGENGVNYSNSCNACRDIEQFEIGGTCEGSVFERND